MSNHTTHHDGCDCVMDKMQKLKAENARLREALKHISVGGPTMPRCCIDAGKAQDLTNHLIEAAEEALNKELMR